jgi:hypothetical protein
MFRFSTILPLLNEMTDDDFLRLVVTHSIKESGALTLTLIKLRKYILEDLDDHMFGLALRQLAIKWDKELSVAIASTKRLLSITHRRTYIKNAAKANPKRRA